MKLVIVSVFDSAAECYGRPFVVQSRGVALRSFRDEVNKSDSPINAHPDDYSLVCLGVFDDNSGELEVCRPEVLLRGKDAIVREV